MKTESRWAVVGAVLALVAAWGLPSRAQGQDSVRVYAATTPDARVLLRWAPPGIEAFYAADSLGYDVARRTAGDTAWARVTPTPVRRYDDERLYRLGDSVDGVAAFFMATRPDSFVQRAPFGLDAVFEARQELESIVGFAMAATLTDRRAAVAAGMYLEDVPEAPGRYLYRVRVAGAADFPEGYAIVDTRLPPTPLPRVERVGAAWSDRAVTLTWDDAPDGYPALYHVYRSVEGGPLARVNPGAILPNPRQRMSFTDSLADNETAVSYVVRAMDNFGRLGPPSPAARGRGVPPVAFSPPSLSPPTELPGRRVRLDWVYADSGAAGIVEQRVFRALRDDGPWQALPLRLGAEARTVIDSGTVAEQQYYRVEAYDAYGRMRRSGHAYFLAVDTVPPPPPTGLEGLAHEDGSVVVAWQPVQDPGLLGYRVFFSNARARAGERLTPRHETVNLFRDTLSLQSLGDSVYYRVVALDLRDNVSAFSEPVAVALPDVHPPEPPRLLSATGDTTGVRIAYVPSPARDAEREEWRRRARGTADWQTFETRPAEVLRRDSSGGVVDYERAFLDATADDRFGYDYQLAVFDDAGLRTLSNIIPGRRRRSAYVPGVEGLSAKPTEDARAATLQWRYGGAAPARYVVYRAPGDAPLRTYIELDPAALERKGPNRRDGSYLYRWRDGDVAYGQAYRYELVLVAADGRESRGAQTALVW